MCKKCVKNKYPQRGSLCSESGAYLANFSGCSGCQGNSSIDNRGLTSSVLKVIDKQMLEGNNSDSDENDSEEKEIISFSHACIQCNHVVAKHMHEFWIEEGYQEYRMECLLCGTGQDSISVMPKDPRKVSCSVQI